jgi:hypothetical protein
VNATTVGDIPSRYTSDIVLNQQARVAHGGGMADCLPGGPVAGKSMAVHTTAEILTSDRLILFISDGQAARH